MEVQEGDSLWSIARKNMEEKSNDYGFTDIYQYIHEIKKCNNMKSNQINTGCYLMVPYYNKFFNRAIEQEAPTSKSMI